MSSELEEREKITKGNFAINEVRKASRALEAAMNALDGYAGWEDLFFDAENLSIACDRLANNIRLTAHR